MAIIRIHRLRDLPNRMEKLIVTSAYLQCGSRASAHRSLPNYVDLDLREGQQQWQHTS